MDTQDFKSQILKCLVSSDAFKSNMGPVRKELIAQKKETIKIFLDTISLIISNKTEVATTRFYALYSLKIATEHSNPMLVSYLFACTELLKALEEQAAFDKDKKFPNRGSTFFSAQPSEAENFTGNHYIALLLEMIKYWDMKYGGTDKGEDNPLRGLYKRLSEEQKVPFPENFFYYKQLAQNQGQKVEQRQSQVNENVDNFQEIQKQLASLENVKVELLQIYETNEDPLESDVLKYFYDDIFALNKQLSEFHQNFLNGQSSTKDETIVADILRLNDQVDLLSLAFQKFTEGSSKWPEHRHVVLNVIQGNKTTTSLSKNHEDQKDNEPSKEKTDPLSLAIENLDLVKSLKAKLREVYEQNDDGIDPQSLRHQYEEIISIGKQLTDLLSMNRENSEASDKSIVDKIFAQKLQIEILCKEYEAFKSQWQMHRSTILGILASNGTKDSGEELDLTERLFITARRVNAPLVEYNASDLYDDTKEADVREEWQVSFEEKKELQLGESNIRKNDEKDPSDELDSTERLFIVARRVNAPLVEYNASDLYEDSNEADVGEECKVSFENYKIDQQKPSAQQGQKAKESNEDGGVSDELRQ